MIHVLWHGGCRGSWAHTIAEWLTTGCEHHNLVEAVPANEGGVVIVKADACTGQGALNNLFHEMRRLYWCLLIVVANEEGQFPAADAIRAHHRIRVWLQTPGPRQVAHRYLPWGWTPMEQYRISSERTLDWCFLGQVTHERRRACVDAIRDIPNGLLRETDGFSKGLPHHLYLSTLSATKMVPCPSGPLTVDSFRVCEALELGAIPMPDTSSPIGYFPKYWSRVFDSSIEETPLPFIKDWSLAPDIMAEWLGNWERRAKTVQEWWHWQKATWSVNFDRDIKTLKDS